MKPEANPPAISIFQEHDLCKNSNPTGKKTTDCSYTDGMNVKVHWQMMV